ncbi:MAG TPA: enoyl-CoA hydratase-related protein [Candidatus Kapabacteria bacterium]|nr:enoyl-CoA hydratase-related protein [Candidatus Kapabacteria bacterium]
MQYETILIERKPEGYAIITLNRPDKLNALNIQLLVELRSAIADIAADAGIRGVIITGSGEKAFAAGADIAELHELDGTTGSGASERGQMVFLMIEQLGKPVIAAVNGFALGGGCELAMACHIRLVSDRAKFGQPEVNLGLIPGFGGTQRLTRLVGAARSAEYNLTGDMIDASTAERIGLANHVYPAAELMERAQEMMIKILSKGPVAIEKTLRAVVAAVDATIEDGLAYEAQLFGECCGTSDMKEGTKAFLEKRAAQFTGH